MRKLLFGVLRHQLQLHHHRLSGLVDQDPGDELRPGEIQVLQLREIGTARGKAIEGGERAREPVLSRSRANPGLRNILPFIGGCFRGKPRQPTLAGRLWAIRPTGARSIPVLIVAASIAALAAPIHAILGEWWIFRRMSASVLPESMFGDGDVVKRYLRGMWHIFTIDLGLSAIALFTSIGNPSRRLLCDLVAAHFAAWVLLLVGFALPRPRILLRLPQLLALAAVAVLAALGR